MRFLTAAQRSATWAKRGLPRKLASSSAQRVGCTHGSSRAIHTLRRTPFIVISEPVGAFQMNQYALCCAESGESAIIDSACTEPGRWVEALQRVLHESQGADAPEVRVTHLIQTHAHLDHVSGVAAAKRAFPNAELLMHSLDEPVRMEAAATALRYGLPPMEECPAPDRFLDAHCDAGADEQRAIKIGSISLRATHTPGHCPGHCIFEIDGELIAFVGDLIFQGSIGRTDLPLCDPAQMRQSLQLALNTLPHECELLPGHGDGTTMATERNSNPFLQGL